MKIYFAIILCLFSLVLEAQTYEGTIGGYPIFLELDLDFDDEEARAFYFYKSQLKEITLEGSQSGSKITLYERFSNKVERKELFTLYKKWNTLSGNWENGDVTFDVELIETQTDLEAFKMQGFEFIRDSISVYGNKELVWFNEKYSEVTFFRLGNGFTKKQREFLNPILDSMHIYRALIFLECGWADFETEVEIVNDEYISFSEYSSIYCGGAHPNHGVSGFNFDLRELKKLEELSEIYPNINFYELLKNTYKNDPDLQEECEYFSEEREAWEWEYFNWVLTESGVTITPSYPHAMTPCNIGFPLLHKELEQDK